MSALMHAIAKERLEIVVALVVQGANVNVTDDVSVLYTCVYIYNYLLSCLYYIYSVDGLL